MFLSGRVDDVVRFCVTREFSIVHSVESFGIIPEVRRFKSSGLLGLIDR